MPLTRTEKCNYWPVVKIIIPTYATAVNDTLDRSSRPPRDNSDPLGPKYAIFDEVIYYIMYGITLYCYAVTKQRPVCISLYFDINRDWKTVK